MTQDSESVVVPREEEVARLAADAATRGASLQCGDYLGAWEEGDHPYGRAGNCPFCDAEQSYTNLWYNGPGSPPSYAWYCCECGARGPTSSGRFRGDHYGAILDAKALWDAAARSTSVREEDARALLTLLVLYDDEAQPRGLQDAVDNTGVPYQSAAMAGLVTAAEMLLDPVRLAAQIAEHRQAVAALVPRIVEGKSDDAR